MGSGFENLILFGLLSLMLLIGTLLRAKVKLFQDYLVPASIIGGLIGFAIVSTGWLKIGEWQITSSLVPVPRFNTSHSPPTDARAAPRKIRQGSRARGHVAD
ncbi:MAG: hypothetical protein ACLRWP_19370 [Bilophila wadsworthia]